MTRRRSNADAVALAKKLLESLDQGEPSNDDEPVIDEDALRERARKAAERMRRARNR